MARIVYDPATIGGIMVAEAVEHIAQAQAKLLRAKSLMDAIAEGGAAPENLETCAEFGVAVSQGSDFYTTINGMKTNVGTVTVAAIASVDMGS